MEALQADRQVTKFRREIKFVWDRLELMARHAQIPSFATFMAGQAKPFERKLKSSSQKWGYYFERERQVLDVIRDYLINASTRFFTEHDGFRTSREVDLMELRDVILTKTGLKLVIKRADTTTSYVDHKCWVKTFDADVATTTTAIVQR